jgi:hypothetical protein
MPRAADLDIGDINPYRGKQAEMLTPVGKQSRDLDRAGLRDLDRRTENLPGMTRHQRDVNRTMPRDGTGPAVRARRLPADTHPRRLTVYRQRILNKQKTALDGDRVPVRAKRAFNKVFTSNDELKAINDQLSASVGDITELDDATRLTVQRVDRIIQLAESHNTADNIVYPDPGTGRGELRKRPRVAAEQLRRRHRGELRPVHRHQSRNEPGHRTSSGVAAGVRDRHASRCLRRQSPEDQRHQQQRRSPAAPRHAIAVRRHQDRSRRIP